MRPRRVLSLSLQAAAAAFFAVLLVALSNPVLGQGAAPKNLTINMQNTKFDPAMASAEVNATVSWVNKDTFGHDVTFLDQTFGSTGGAGGVTSGQKFEHKFDKPGLYEYYCRAHSPQGFGGSGMFGRLVVMSPPFSPIGAGAEELNPEHIGVRWLAHWVGIISFIAVFAVLIIYYFVLKYGETVHTTDHRERKEK